MNQPSPNLHHYYLTKILLLFLTISHSSLSSSQHHHPCKKKTQNLPPSAPLRIGKLLKRTCPKHSKTKNGQYLILHYSSHLYTNCKPIDINQTITIRLGSNNVLRAFNDGLKQMCIGEQRRITSSASNAFGSKFHRGTLTIVPPNATVVWDVELKEVAEDAPREFLMDVFEASDAFVPRGSPAEEFVVVKDTLEMAKEYALDDPVWGEENWEEIERMEELYRKNVEEIERLRNRTEGILDDTVEEVEKGEEEVEKDLI